MAIQKIKPGVQIYHPVADTRMGCFMTLSKKPSIYAPDKVGNEWNTTTYFIGGMIGPRNRWIKIDPELIRGKLGYDFMDPSANFDWDEKLRGHGICAPFLEPPKSSRPKFNYKIPVLVSYYEKFLYAVVDDFKSFSHDTRSSFFKGRTFGKTIENDIGIILKCLKTGFNAIGVNKHVFKLRRRAFEFRDIRRYSQSMMAEAARTLKANITDGFQAYSPKRGITPRDLNRAGTADPILVFQRKHSSPLLYNAHLKKLAKLRQDQLKGSNTRYVRVNEYGFRGDKRAPVEIWNMGGFTPNAIRDDRQALLESREGTGSFSGREMVLDSVLHQDSDHSDTSGYVSFSRSVRVAGGYAYGGYVYVCKVRDGVSMEDTLKNPIWGKEHEVSAPGGTDWEDVAGFRETKNGEFTGKVYLRNTLPGRIRERLRDHLSVNPLSPTPQYPKD